MAEFTLKVRRFQPEDREGPYWESFDVDLDPTLSVLDGLLQAKDRDDGSLAVRCSCRAAICGSCGVKINGQSTLACKTMLEEAQAYAESHTVGAQTDGDATAGNGKTEIVVEPMGNMPVIKDLVTDMESTHWTKIRRVTPWLLPEGDPPEREYIVPPESMIDVTQSMACIQCGACVSACLSMEADPDFIGPAALAKAYRFVGDPRDAQTKERLHPLLQLHRRLSEGGGADGPDHAPAPCGDRRPRDRRRQQRPPPRSRFHEDHREEGDARRGAAAAGVVGSG